MRLMYPKILLFFILMIYCGRVNAAPLARIYAQNTIQGQNTLLTICRGTSLTFRYVANNGLKYIVSGGIDVANKRTNVNGLGLGFELGIVFTPKPRYCKPLEIFKKGGGSIDAGYDSRSNSKSKRGRMECPSFINDASKIRGYESDMF